MKSAILFDLDGTLIDTPRGIVETFTAALASMGIPFNDSFAIRATIGMPLEKAFSMLMNVDLNDEKVPYAVKQYQALFKDIVLPKAKELIFPGVVEGLVKLRSQGFALAVATSKVYPSAEALLKAADLFEHFDLVVGADQVTHPKPHPEMGQVIMKKLNVLAEHTAMVGDTTHDILMAKNAGMHSAAVTYGIHDFHTLQSAEPTWIADTFDEALSCIRIGLLKELQRESQ
ncbi:MAG: HAD family hydrolase [Taibaiella sp.]|jgi:phosphoglycolate phosphatase